MKGDEKDGIKEKGIRQGNDRGVWLGGAFGIDQHYSVALWMDLDLLKCNSTILVAVFSVLTGGIWGILLCRNC